ncbi:MAG: DEAD/DEAH box helicase, partial [Firmicutes bacterium]|nr:DEAD/DEAH box helicase [Bacillota bacterium]
FFLRQYRQLTDLRRVQDSYRIDDLTEQLFTDNGRSMILTPQALDDFLELMEGRTFLFDKRYRFLYSHLAKNRMGRSLQEQGFQRNVRTQEGQPLLPLTLTVEEDGVTLNAETLPFRCKGHRHLYLLMDPSSEILWKTDDEYRKKMEPFLDSLERSDKELFIANHDLTRFCVNVFTSIRPWLDIDGDVTYLDQFLPWDMEAQLYLDSPAPGVITARPFADYGPIRINLVNERQEATEEFSVTDSFSSSLRRNDIQETRFTRLLDRWFTEIDLASGIAIIRDDDDAIYEFLKHGQAELSSRSRLFVTDRYRRLIFPAKNKISAGVSISGQLLNVTFDIENFPPDELGELLSSYRVKRRYYKLKNGSYLSLEDGEVRDAMELASGLQLTKEEMNAGRAQLPRYRALYVEECTKHTGNLTVQKDDNFRQLIHSIRDIDQSTLPIPKDLEPILRDYQKTGYRWLKAMSELGFGGILADDMGLGKTLEVITLLTSAAEDPFSIDLLALVTCPASLVWNWARELERFSPGLKAVTLTGSAAIRKKQLAELQALSPEEQRRCVVITSYDLLKRDLESYSSLYFQYHVIDEAQYIKNFATKNAKAVNALHSGVRFALTGTPIENRLSDLWSIFHFLMPGYLGNYQQFKHQYERPIVEDKDETTIQLLHAQVRPFILRRLKQNVLKELPEKVESVVYVPLEGEQQKLYMANLAKAKLEVGNAIAEGGFETKQLEILALLTRLRQICCHPALCYEDYTGRSAKLETCMELIREAITAGHRILLFSQFTSMLSLIETELRAEGINYYLLTGQTPKATRQNLVTSFNEGTTPVFLISLKAGGTGLNLTSADVVIHFDPWWNIAAQNQATDRAHRIGQRHSVQVYKLVADGTIEDKILNLQAMKGTLADSVIQSADPESILHLLQDHVV